MADALEDVENMVLSFSLAEQIRLLNFVADNINKKKLQFCLKDCRKRIPCKKCGIQVWRQFGRA